MLTTESFLSTLRVERSISMTSVISPLDCVGSTICFTVPLLMPPTRTSEPPISPPTFLNEDFKRYVDEKRNCLSPIRNTPMPSTTSDPKIKAPRRTGVHIHPPQ